MLYGLIFSYAVCLFLFCLFIYLFASARLEMSASAPRTFLMLRNGKQIMRRQTCIVLEWNLAGFDLPTHTHTHLSRCPDRDTDIELEKEWLGYSSWLHCEPFFHLSELPAKHSSVVEEEFVVLFTCVCVVILANYRKFNCN